MLCELTLRLALLCCITHNDLATTLAGLLHRQCSTQPLLVFPQSLTFPEAILLHDLMSHGPTAREGKGSLRADAIDTRTHWIYGRKESKPLENLFPVLRALMELDSWSAAFCKRAAVYSWCQRSPGCLSPVTPSVRLWILKPSFH